MESQITKVCGSLTTTTTTTLEGSIFEKKYQEMNQRFLNVWESLRLMINAYSATALLGLSHLSAYQR